MTGRPTWWRWVAGLMAALLLASLGASSATAGTPTCPDDIAAMSKAAETAPQASADTAGDICPDGCVACGHCQSHHAAISLLTGSPAVVERFAHPERRTPFSTAPPNSHLADRLKRPPRA